MPYTSIALIICCAVFYYQVGESEYNGGELLALASVALWGLGILAFGFGTTGNLLLQAGLFFALTFWNMHRAKRR
jgi:hypothetical protein